MDAKKIMQIFEDTAFVRTGGSPEELRCAEYLRGVLAEMGLEAKLEAFDVPMANMEQAELIVDGESIPCKGYLCAGSWDVEAPLYYLRGEDPWSLSQCKDKIVLVDGSVGHWLYKDLRENGALGYITYDGALNQDHRDIDQKEQRELVHEGNRMPAVNLNAKDAFRLIKEGCKSARIILKQEEYTGKSHNIVLDMPGEIDEFIVLSAHYDSTSLSVGSYDNMSGSVGLLGLAEYFAKTGHRYGLRFVWCGSEERGLLGAKAYTAAHEEELKKAALNINLDMIGCVMGKFFACCTCEEKLSHYPSYMAAEKGLGIGLMMDAYSSDSTPFADKGVPAMTFARHAPQNIATIHNRYDTAEVLSAEQMLEDIDFIAAFTRRMAQAKRCPVDRKIPERMKEKIDIYLCRKRAPKL